PGPAAPEPAPERRGVPGFDTRTYPGDDVMAAWLDASPYRWVGYYLPAPCYTGASWEGKRATLERMGWGTAVLFIGEQDWPDAETADSAGLRPPTDSLARERDRERHRAPADAGEGARCTSANLTGERGREDGRAAARAARAEGFEPGTVVYLDVEPVESVSDSLARYVEGWTAALVDAGFEPGLYAHARNAETLRALMVEAAGAEPRLWVASPRGFNLRRGPAESGYRANIWQGVLDIDESWGGTTLRIDANVADRADPSG
ncbi:MAG: glycoside hydrolase domain-containing protein, partial [Gemmatimonadota bacterium]